jgi:hypothetical protein
MMPTTLESVVTKYLRSGSPAQRTREEYATTLRKWSRWGGVVELERLGRKEMRELLDWVHQDVASRTDLLTHFHNPNLGHAFLTHVGGFQVRMAAFR